MEGTEVSELSVPGELKVGHPQLMSPGASDFVTATIHVIPQSASAAPLSIELIAIPPNAPRVLGEQRTHRADILIAERMRLELQGEAFDPVPHYPSVQMVDLYEIERVTIWAWTITAPNTLGHHVLTIRAYMGEDETPSYVGSFEIDVVAFTPTPGPPGMPSSLLPAISTVLLLVVILAGLAVVVYKRNQEAGRQWVTDDDHTYRVAAIRQMLLAAFTADELYRFCVDHPSFRPITDSFGPGQGLDDMVDEVIEYCRTRRLWRELLDEVAEANPRQYERFEPYLNVSKAGQSTDTAHE